MSAMTYDFCPRILAVDPGPELSAWVEMDGMRPVACGKDPTAAVRALVHASTAPVVGIEMIASYGMGVGAEVFQTCLEIGRMVERCPHALLVPRLKVKLYHCYMARAKDGNVRQAIIDRYGGKVAAIGCKATPGPLYGIRADIWQALALALYLRDLDGL